MSNYLVLFVGTLYFVIGLGYIIDGRWRLGGLYWCYALGNVFLYLVATERV